MPRTTPAAVIAKERQFAASYAKTLSGTKAAEDMGLTGPYARKYGSRMLRRPRVQVFLQALQRAQVAKFEMTAGRIKEELWNIATVDPAEAFDSEGYPLPLHKMPPHVRSAVKSVRVEVLPSGVMRCALDFWSKVDALHIAAKHLALLAPREVTVTHRFPHADLSDADLKQRLLEAATTIDAEPVP